jgi:NAD(P)H-dependent FMN reductase
MPVYRASYTGQLKAFLDLFPQDALRGKESLWGRLHLPQTPLRKS